MSAKMDAAARLLAAEVEYLRESGWIPLAPVRPGGIVRWQKPRASSLNQEEALRLQKAKDNWPNLKE